MGSIYYESVNMDLSQMENDHTAHPVHLADVSISGNGQALIGQTVQSVARHLGVEPRVLIGAIKRHCRFEWTEPSGTLWMIADMPSGSDIEQIKIAIPRSEWEVRPCGNSTAVH